MLTVHNPFRRRRASAEEVGMTEDDLRQLRAVRGRWWALHEDGDEFLDQSVRELELGINLALAADDWHDHYYRNPERERAEAALAEARRRRVERA